MNEQNNFSQKNGLLRRLAGLVERFFGVCPGKSVFDAKNRAALRVIPNAARNRLLRKTVG